MGIDRRNDPKDILSAYNTPLHPEFAMNGLSHANRILEQQLFDPGNFELFGTYDEDIGRYEAYYRSLESQELIYALNGRRMRIYLGKDELIHLWDSYKYSPEESAELFQNTKMKRIRQWTSRSKRFDMHLLSKVLAN